MEAMACGCSVVASRVGGCPELIEHGVHGLLVEPGNLEELAASISTFVKDPDLRSRVARAGSDRIRTQFSTAASCKRLETIYQRHLKTAGC
jgi:glycosyltransferase involved in cell wall biosynthesis